MDEPGFTIEEMVRGISLAAQNATSLHEESSTSTAGALLLPSIASLAISLKP
jgi:hypothetical protein